MERLARAGLPRGGVVGPAVSKLHDKHEENVDLFTWGHMSIKSHEGLSGPVHLGE